MPYSKDTHPGDMPIRVLRYNLVHNIENIRPDILNQYKEWVTSGKLNPEIKWLIDNQEVKPPHVDLIKKQINLQETYLSFIWALTYSLFVIYEEGIQKKMINKHWEGNIVLDTPLLQNAEKLFNWAITLIDHYSKWSHNLPNPELQRNEEEKFFVEKVNGIFLDVVTFIFFHECSHLVNNHYEVIKKYGNKKPHELLVNELEEYKEIEKEADLFALETIIRDYDTDRFKIVKGLAVVLAYISNFFIIIHPKSIKQCLHPDLDTRLHNALEYLGQDLHKYDYIWYLACFACRTFFGIHKITVEFMESNDSIDLFYRYLRIFDDLKS